MANNGNGQKKFLIVSIEGLASDLAWVLKKEGNDVRFSIQNKEDKDICDGVVEKVDDWQKHIDWADVIIFDDIGFGAQADKLRKAGKAVVGGSSYTDRLEDDREFGQIEMRKLGINILPHSNFDDFDVAIKFIRDNPGRYVLKPSGSAQNEKELLFVGQDDDGRDLIEMLERYKRAWAKKIKVFQLQKYVAGVEIAVGAFFNGQDFITPINVNFEHKRMFPGELGPSTGEMGTSMYWTEPNAIFNTTLTKLQPALKESGYVGYIDINCIVNARGIYPLELTSRFGYPTISIHMEGVNSKWGEFFHAISRGQPFKLDAKKGFQVGVVIAVPPFPFRDPKAFVRYSEEAAIIFRKPSLDGVHIGDVKQVEEDWRLAGDSGYALIITGSGSTMEEARKQAYNRVRNIIIPNMFYRTDIGTRWYHDSDRLQTWGYLP
jgi:phosphoribosylamine--glycine ligase